MGEKINAHRKSEGKRRLGISRHSWKIYIKMDFK
jgi:hypothetical protein